jgi:lysozyme family protein
VVVSENLVQRWESAYRRYSNASRTAVSASGAGEPNAAREMAEASREVAAAWHEIESQADMPWFVLAAFVAAAQAFEFQARDWNARADHAWPPDTGGVKRPRVQLATRVRPTPRRRGEARNEP